MKKIWYDKTSGYLCDRYPKDLQITDDTPFIEVEDEVEAQTYSVERGKFWAVRDGELQMVDDAELIATKEYKRHELELELEEIQQWFSKTDWMKSKVFLGEWSTDDKRWKDYLKERAVKRARQDEINLMLEGE